jgi:hypothetical protein
MNRALKMTALTTRGGEDQRIRKGADAQAFAQFRKSGFRLR